MVALGEKSSIVVALGRNEDSNLETVERRSKKATGAKVDILFKICNKELSSCEIEKDNVTIVDDKYRPAALATYLTDTTTTLKRL